MNNINKQILEFEIKTGQSLFGQKLTKKEIKSNKTKLKRSNDTNVELQI